MVNRIKKSNVFETWILILLVITSVISQSYLASADDGEEKEGILTNGFDEWKENAKSDLVQYFEEAKCTLRIGECSKEKKSAITGRTITGFASEGGECPPSEESVFHVPTGYLKEYLDTNKLGGSYDKGIVSEIVSYVVPTVDNLDVISEGYGVKEKLKTSSELEFFYATEKPTSFGAPKGFVTCSMEKIPSGFKEIYQTNYDDPGKPIWVRIDTDYTDPQIKGAVGHYYNVMNHLRFGQLAAVERIAAIDVFNDELHNSGYSGSSVTPMFLDVHLDSKNPFYDELVSYMSELKTTKKPKIDAKKIVKGTIELQEKIIPPYSEKRIELLKVFDPLNEEYEELEHLCSITDCGDINRERLKKLKGLKEVVEKDLSEVEGTSRSLQSIIAPWVMGNVFFQTSIWNPTHIAISAQLQESRNALLHYLEESENVAIMMNSPDSEFKETNDEIFKVLKKTAPYKKFTIEPLGKGEKVLEKLSANYYLDLSDTNMNYGVIVKQSFVTQINSPEGLIMMTGALLLTGWVAGPYASAVYLARGISGAGTAVRSAGALRALFGFAMIGTDLLFSVESIETANEVCTEKFFFDREIGIDDDEKMGVEPLADFGPAVSQDFRTCLVASVLAGADVALVIVPEAVGEILALSKYNPSAPPPGVSAERINRAKRILSAADDISILKYYQSRDNLARLLFEQGGLTASNINIFRYKIDDLLRAEGVNFQILTVNRGLPSEKTVTLIIPDPNGAPLNRLASGLQKKQDTVLIVDLDAFINKPNVVAYYSDGVYSELGEHINFAPKSMALVGPEGSVNQYGVFVFAKSTLGHEIIHSITHGAKFRGVESFLDSGVTLRTFGDSSTVSTNPYWINPPYADWYSVDEITANLYTIRLSLSKMKSVSNKLNQRLLADAHAVDQLLDSINDFTWVGYESNLAKVKKFSQHSRDVTETASNFIGIMDSSVTTRMDISGTLRKTITIKKTDPLTSEGVFIIIHKNRLENGQEILEVSIQTRRTDSLGKASGTLDLKLTNPEDLAIFDDLVNSHSGSISDVDAKDSILELLKRDNSATGGPYVGTTGQLNKIKSNADIVNQQMEEMTQSLSELQDILTNVNNEFALLKRERKAIVDKIDEIRGKIYNYNSVEKKWEYSIPQEIMFPKHPPASVVGGSAGAISPATSRAAAATISTYSPHPSYIPFDKTVEIAGGSRKTLDFGGIPEGAVWENLGLTLPDGKRIDRLSFLMGGDSKVKGGLIHWIFRHVDPDADIHRAANNFVETTTGERAGPASLFVEYIGKDPTTGKPILRPMRGEDVFSLLENEIRSGLTFTGEAPGIGTPPPRLLFFETTGTPKYKITLIERNGNYEFSAFFIEENPFDNVQQLSNKAWNKFRSGKYRNLPDGTIVLN